MVNEIQSNNVKITMKLTNKHVMCSLTDLIEQEGHILIDSGSDMNLIKISKLKGNLNSVRTVIQCARIFCCFRVMFKYYSQIIMDFCVVCLKLL